MLLVQFYCKDLNNLNVLFLAQCTQRTLKKKFNIINLECFLIAKVILNHRPYAIIYSRVRAQLPCQVDSSKLNRVRYECYDDSHLILLASLR